MSTANEQETAVIFRTFREGGECIALFPLEPASSSDRGWDCLSYMHIGQHGAATPDLMRNGATRAATGKESAPLARELRSCGYRLRVMRRFPRNAYDVRRSKL